MARLSSSRLIRLAAGSVLGMAAGGALGQVAAGGAAAVVGAAIGAAVAMGWAWLMSLSSPRRAFERLADGLARVAFLLLVVAIAFGLIAGTAIVIVWRPTVGWQVYNRPHVIQSLAMMLVIVLSLPSLLLGAWYMLRGPRKQGTGRLLAFFGPLIVFVVGEGLTPHLEIPWHQIVHTLFGSFPLAVAYWFALRRWHPSVVMFRGQPKYQGGLHAHVE